MKYKLSDRLNAFLNDNVLPKFKGEAENEILGWMESGVGGTYVFWVKPEKSVHGLAFQLYIDEEDIEEIEPLKPYVWYEREKFDGNPEDYPLVESTGETYCCTYKLGSKTLYSTTKHFMYIELC